jgi:hypothetical protein
VTQTLEPTGGSGETPLIAADVRRFPWIRKLASDYAHDFGAVSSFFG